MRTGSENATPQFAVDGRRHLEYPGRLVLSLGVILHQGLAYFAVFSWHAPYAHVYHLYSAGGQLLWLSAAAHEVESWIAGGRIPKEAECANVMGRALGEE